MTIDVMHLIDVNMVGLKPSQTVLAGFANMVSRKPAIVRARSHRLIDFCRQNDAFTAATLLKPATNNFLGQPRALLDIGRLFSAIHVCCINEIDTRLKRLIQNAGAGLLVGDVTKIHGSETKAADFQAGAAKMRIVHKRLR